MRNERRNTLLQQVPWQECEAYERFALSDVWEEVWNSIQSAELHECLMQLPSEQRKMIELAYFNGLTHSEIARHCQIPLGTVKARIRLGVLHLRQVLEQRGDGEKCSISHIAGAGASSKQTATVLVQAAECGCATGYLLCREEGCHCFGYTEWEHLLVQIEVFEFLGKEGNLTVRKEKRGHDHDYWYAYTWGSAGRRKAYIGLAAELTLTRLETMAKKLHEGQED